MNHDARSLPRTTSLCVHGAQFVPLRMRALEGQESSGVVDLKPLMVGEQTFEARAGDTWRHPVGVPHSSVALEDCLAVEVKSPPRKTWNTDVKT